MSEKKTPSAPRPTPSGQKQNKKQNKSYFPPPPSKPPTPSKKGK